MRFPSLLKNVEQGLKDHRLFSSYYMLSSDALENTPHGKTVKSYIRQRVCDNILAMNVTSYSLKVADQWVLDLFYPTHDPYVKSFVYSLIIKVHDKIWSGSYQER